MANPLRSRTMFAFALAVSSGCTQYVEEKTPPGEVPPPRSASPRPGSEAPIDSNRWQGRRGFSAEPEFLDASWSPAEADDPPAAVEETVTVRAKRLDPTAAPTPSAGGDFADASSSSPRSLRGFAAAYEANQRPRIATFFNRALSSEVREWRTATVVQTRQESMEIATSDSANHATVQRDGTSSSYSAPLTETAGARQSPEEAWIWAFEEGFSQALLAEQVRVVDRAIILRLSAFTAGPSASLPAIEIEALKSYADILVELLIVADAESPLGYSFRATAKDVRTGELLVTGTLLDWSKGSSPRVKKKVVVTDKGYELVADVLPSVREVGGDLAKGVMLALEDHWRR